jgi:hypothetical protein
VIHHRPNIKLWRSVSSYNHAVLIARELRTPRREAPSRQHGHASEREGASALKRYRLGRPSPMMALMALP